MVIGSFEHAKGSGFGEDRLNRRTFAQKLASRIADEGIGKVFALDAPWGTGKTVFLRQFADLLQIESTPENRWNVVYYDAFKEDFADDAFVPLVSAVLENLTGEDEPTPLVRKIGKSAVPIVKRLLGAGLRGSLKIATAGLVDGAAVSEAASAAVTDEIDAIGDALYASLLAGKAKQQELQAFAEALNEALEAADGNRTLIIIDELDRCRPEFAVQTLERVKHIFDKVNCTFLFGINRPELAAIVQGYYGPDFSGRKYLQRFFDFELTFPAQRRHETAFQHLTSLAQQQQDQKGVTKYFQRMLKSDFLRFEATLRDIEKIIQFGRYRDLQTAYSVPEMMLATCLIVAKVCRPEDFERIVAAPPDWNTWVRLFRDGNFLDFQQKEETEAFSGFLDLALKDPPPMKSQADVKKIENSFHLAKGNIGATNGPYLMQRYADHFLQGLD